MERPIFAFTIGLLSILALASCQQEESVSNAIIIADQDGALYNPVIDSNNFVSAITHPYLTLTPGKSWTFEGVTEDGVRERILVEVTDETKVILGVTATIVRDRVWQGDELVEDTRDWYAEDKEGNVWYLGEDVDNYENGVLKDHGGAWEAGVNGAKPGIIMKANPNVGDKYRQELLKGEAEDMGEVLGVHMPLQIASGRYEDCLQVKDWTPLEPDIVEHKYFCSEVGNVVLEEKVAGETGRVELIETTSP